MAIYPELRGRTVLITGGANGIGAATVRAFAGQQVRLFFCDRDAIAGRRLARETGGTFRRVDLLKPAQIQHWINSVGALSRIDVLVNNAAIDPRMALKNITSGKLDRLFAVNLRAGLLAIRDSVPFMKRGGGSIINLASITFYNSPPQMSAYVATKGGVLGMTRSLARELGPRRIRVNAVSPGWIMTERQLRQYVTPAVRRLIKRSQSIPELIQPEEIAEVILFLASPASRAITGQELLADRGWCHS